MSHKAAILFHSVCFTCSVFPSDYLSIKANEFKFFAKGRLDIRTNYIKPWIEGRRVITKAKVMDMEGIERGISKSYFIPFYFLLYDKNYSLTQLYEITKEIITCHPKEIIKKKLSVSICDYEEKPHLFLYSKDIYFMTKHLIELRLSETEKYNRRHYRIFPHILARVPQLALMDTFKNNIEYLVEALSDLLHRHFYSTILLKINFDWLNSSIKKNLKKKSFLPNIDHFEASLENWFADPCIYQAQKTKIKAIRATYLTYH